MKIPRGPDALWGAEIAFCLHGRSVQGRLPSGIPVKVGYVGAYCIALGGVESSIQLKPICVVIVRALPETWYAHVVTLPEYLRLIDTYQY